ncbi:MAG: ATP-dependent protease LonB [Candidatus Micrarchaeota archaeon]|nr:ATP-dependent protease LonB [Candidatus Micrarchaeota archaeon]MDE1833764.1 ATP-dependent protease LonB [Candidatus Micrarchaeota archaeon]MDE1859210.1 ATP-dependent protease LonB [Candidatus Micrarchaeota archaeon]
MVFMKRFKTTEDINIPKRIVDQVIGQERAVNIIKKAANQHRNVLLIGSPGTGKTLLAQAIAELLPVTDMEDVLVYRNPNDENHPLVKSLKTYPKIEEGKPLGDGQGRQLVQRERLKTRLDMGKSKSNVTPIVAIIVIILVLIAFAGLVKGYLILLVAGLIVGILVFASVLVFVGSFRRVGIIPGMFESNEPKLIVDNTGMTHAPFMDGTGARAGHLFGDVKHDPLQSGGLGTPAHLRVESGLIHKANKGVLFIDEVADLEPKSQQELLTAMQEKKYAITGQSELSSGAMVRTETVPCDFLLVAAGNMEDMQKMHPALRSRIRGYGYEVYMESDMPDNEQNREKLVRFIAQEIRKDGKIPPFNYDACMEIIEEARRRSGRKNRLTLILRELGGVIRAAGDIATDKNKKIVTPDDVRDALKLTKPIEAQFVDQSLEYRKDYKIFKTSGFAIGRVNGLAIIGSSYLSAGVVLPIVAEVTRASSRTEGKLIPTGKLGTIAKEAVKNISAIIKRHMEKDMANYDVHVQFIQTYEGVEGDSASISVAVAVISAIEGIPVNQEIAMTGSLSVRGDVLPVGGITNKVVAAIEAGMKYVLIPQSNEKDIFIGSDELRKVKVIPVKNIAEVLEYALKKSPRRDQMVKTLKKYMTSDYKEREPLEVPQVKPDGR